MLYQSIKKFMLQLLIKLHFKCILNINLNKTKHEKSDLF